MQIVKNQKLPNLFILKADDASSIVVVIVTTENSCVRWDSGSSL